MCIGNQYVWIMRGPKWEKQPVPCRKCWQCRTKRRNDYVGRMLCEANVSDKVAFVTCTYADRDDNAETIITKSHFQQGIRALRDQGRKRGFSVRYFVAAEIGSKGTHRVHFHAILFFKKERPDARLPQWKNEERDWDPVFWGENGVPHGHIYCIWNPPEHKFAYCAKYCLKEQDIPGHDAPKWSFRQSWISMSKKPALGAAWIEAKAQRHADHMIWPRTFEYQAPAGVRGRKYALFGASRRDFLLRLKELFGGWPPLETVSKWMRKSIEKVQRALDMEKAMQWAISPEADEELRLRIAEKNHADAQERASERSILERDKTALYALLIEYCKRHRYSHADIPGIRKDLEWLRNANLLPERLQRLNPRDLLLRTPPPKDSFGPLPSGLIGLI